jgi:ankyrin repeat protein
MSKTAEFFTVVESGDTGRVRALLAADPALAKARDDEGATAMHYATENGHREIVRFLKKTGADINARDDRFDATPTGWAIEYVRELGGLLASRSMTCSSQFARATCGGFAGC